jgi:hypothetical protein
MSPDLKTNAAPGLTPLVTGIVEDAQTLIAQQLSLFQSEIKQDLGRIKAAAMPLSCGVAVCLLAGFFLGTMVVRLLTDVWPELPAYGANAIVGVILAVLGGGLAAAGITQLNKIDLHSNKAVKGLKENVQWTTKT